MSKAVSVAGVTVDPVTKSPIVILREPESGNVVPIWIGLLEANAIALALDRALDGAVDAEPALRDEVAPNHQRRSKHVFDGLVVRRLPVLRLRSPCHWGCLLGLPKFCHRAAAVKL